MEQLPIELLYDIALKSEPHQLFILCQTNLNYSHICNDENFWKLKYKIDIDLPLAKNHTFGSAYRKYFNGKLRYLPVYLMNNKLIGFIWVNNTDTLQNIENEIKSLSSDLPPKTILIQLLNNHDQVLLEFQENKITNQMITPQIFTLLTKINIKYKTIIDYLRNRTSVLRKASLKETSYIDSNG